MKNSKICGTDGFIDEKEGWEIRLQICVKR